MGDGRISVSFACQRCLQPIKIDDSFDRIDEHKLAELSRKKTKGWVTRFRGIRAYLARALTGNSSILSEKPRGTWGTHIFCQGTWKTPTFFKQLCGVPLQGELGESIYFCRGVLGFIGYFLLAFLGFPFNFLLNILSTTLQCQ